MDKSLACIRCSQCEMVCPVALKPQFLHAAINAQTWDRVDELQIEACLICNACTTACPSQINLRNQFLDAQTTLKDLKAKQEASSRAKIRFEAREARLIRKKELQTAQRIAKLKEVALDEKKAAIKAALARAKWKYEDA